MNCYLILCNFCFLIPSWIIFDFNPTCDLSNWYVVNDGVMGGLSKGTLKLDDEGHAIFKGYVSLDNNGGFTSIRYDFDQIDVSKYRSMKIRLKGDGKRYQFRVKSNPRESHSYIGFFDTNKDWEIIEINLAELYPSFRGYALDLPNYSVELLSYISFLISNKKEESFELMIDKIWLE